MEKLNFTLVFLEGLLSFLSPCVLPILPIYMTVLSRSGVEQGESNNRRTTLIRNTVLFVLGISTTFFILGTGIGIFKTFFMMNKRLLLIGGGILIVLMGLFYIGDLKIPFLQKERKFHYQVKGMNPLTAYILGFTFSFGWTPCIGPMLASVLVVASTSSNVWTGNLLIATYTLGFIIPFIILAFFSEKMIGVLDKVKLHRERLQKIGGYILILMGLIMTFNGARTPKFVQPLSNTSQQEVQITEENQLDEVKNEEEVEEEKVLAPDFTLVDQYGNIHTLSEYKGKTVFLNFWATWCPPCRAEMPYIEELYNEYGLNKEDVAILGVAMPNLGREKSKEEVIKFLGEHEFTFPVVFDETGQVMNNYYISVFPTTYLINPDGTIEGYVPGGMTKDIMKELIEMVRTKE